MNTGSIVIVDDEEVLLEALDRLVKREFHTNRVQSTTDPEEAKQWLENECPSILITDIRMPKLSGLELLSSASQIWGSFPVIIMSAFASPRVDDLIQLGTFKYLSKPFPTQQLIRLIRDIISPARIGFDGVVTVSMLADVIQLQALAASTGVLYIDSDAGSGSIWFLRGQLVHAATVSCQGAEAFFEIMEWQGGRFSFAPRTTEARTLHTPYSELLLEAYRRRDEKDASKTKEECTPLSPGKNHAESDEFEVFFDLFDEKNSLPKEELHKKPILPKTSPDTVKSTKEENFILPRHNIAECLGKLEEIPGFLGGCVANVDTGYSLEGLGDIGQVVKESAEMMRGQREIQKLLFSSKNFLEEVLLAFDKQYHLIRPIKNRPSLFFFAMFDRSRVNLAFARISLGDVEKNLVLEER